jgi:hypothetical protein
VSTSLPGLVRFGCDVSATVGRIQEFVRRHRKRDRLARREENGSDKAQRAALARGRRVSAGPWLAGRDAIYQLIPWVRRWDMGEPSLTRSFAAPRAAHPYPPDHVLNAAGNRVIGLNASRAKFQMRTAVAVWQHARDRIRRRAGRACAIEPRSNQKSGWCQLVVGHRASV